MPSRPARTNTRAEAEHTHRDVAARTCTEPGEGAVATLRGAADHEGRQGLSCGAAQRAGLGEARSDGAGLAEAEAKARAVAAELLGAHRVLSEGSDQDRGTGGAPGSRGALQGPGEGSANGMLIPTQDAASRPELSMAGKCRKCPHPTGGSSGALGPGVFRTSQPPWEHATATVLRHWEFAGASKSEAWRLSPLQDQAALRLRLALSLSGRRRPASPCAILAGFGGPC